MLLPVIGLSRRADVAEVIGAGLVAKAAGLGHRRIGVLLSRPAETVRGWLRRFAGRAESVRAGFTALAVDVDAGTAPPLAAGSGFGDAVAAVLAVAVRWPGLALTVRLIRALTDHAMCHLTTGAHSDAGAALREALDYRTGKARQ